MKCQKHHLLGNPSPEGSSQKRNRREKTEPSETELSDDGATPLPPEGSELPLDVMVPTIHLSKHDGIQSQGEKADEPPTLHSPFHNDDCDSITKAFEKYKAVYIPRHTKGLSKNVLHWKDLSGIFERLDESDKKSFCIENSNAGKFSGVEGEDLAHGWTFLKDHEDSSARDKNNTSNRSEDSKDNTVGYCSFLIQNDKKALSEVLDLLPVQDPIVKTANASDSTIDTDVPSADSWDYEPCLWVFFGRNNPRDRQTDLQGRPEHTDQISHDGTWHYQLSGSKRWLLRPTPQLLRNWNQHNKSDSDELLEPIVIDCREGDVLIVNTRLWRHQTILPAQRTPSVSYARDFWIQKRTEDPERNHGTENSNMTNVDGLYAMDDIAEDTIIFKEDDMPDCELHRSNESNSNCKVVELEDGLHAVVSSRFIRAGEFFCIPESSDEEEDQTDEDDVDDR